MSLLPGTMLPQTAPLGVAGTDGRVMISKDWWLLLYNLSAQVLGIGNAGLPADALIDLAAADIDAADSDAIALRSQISALANLIPDPDVPSADPRALVLALDSLLPDPVPRAQPATAITVGASPFTYTASFDGLVVATGGTVSDISLTRGATTVTTGVLLGVFPLRRLDQLVVTYTVAPTMTFFPN